MPTQIPPGSGLAVRVKSPKFKRRRAFWSGPKRLIYADGGLVDRWGQKRSYVPSVPQEVKERLEDEKEWMELREAMERRKASEAAMNASMRKERAARLRRDAREAEMEYLKMRKEEDETLPEGSPLRRTPHLRET